MTKIVKKEFHDFIFLIKNDYPIEHIKLYIKELPKPLKRDMTYLKREIVSIFKKYENILIENVGIYDLFEINQLKEKISTLTNDKQIYYLWLNNRYIILKDVAFFIYNLPNLVKNIEKN